ncbi:MAG: SDR family oxidoreductase [Bacteroidetes bacterium]|nr:MAG: SDR family oxidoreductase [Bacteroidota bacterium]
MRVLVTGHKGYIGSVLTPMLVDDGHEVVGLDVDLYKSCLYGNLPIEYPCLTKDIRDVEASDLSGFEAIIHLAGLSNDPLGDLNPDLTYEINHAASVGLAKAAKKMGVRRFLFSSSCSNYGSSGADFIDESAPFRPVTPYAKSKVMVEADLAKLADSKFSPIILRNATAYGMSPKLRFDLVLNNLVAWAYTTGSIFLKSDGTPWRPIVHIEDISCAFIAMLNAPLDLVHNQAFNVGRAEENYQVYQLAELVKEVMPDCRIEFADNAGPDKRCYRVDCSKIASTLPEFKPKWNARDGIMELLSAFKANGLALDDFEGSRYKRVDHIKQLLQKGRLDTSLRWNESG